MYAYFKHGREPLSSYTHFWGAAAGVLGILALLLRAHQAGAGGMALAGALVFGVSLVALYAASSLYHYALCGPKPLLRLRKLDHAMIYVLIAGSYTPFCLRYMNRQMLPLFLAAIWGAALAGILLKLLWLDAPRWLGTGLYLALGWAIAADLKDFGAMPGGCLALVAVGGVCYSAGAVIYLVKRPNLGAGWGFHELFHLFILAGSAFHFAAVYAFVL